MTYEKYEKFFISHIKERQKNTGIYIWGNGLWGKYAKELLDQHEIDIAGFIDNDKAKAGMIQENGVMVYAPEQVSDLNAFFIIAVKKGIEDICRQCHDLGIEDSNLIIFDDLMNARVRDTYKNAEVISAYENVWPGCCDATIDDIIQYSGINSLDKIFEIGAGAGKVADMFLERGYSLDLLEISDEQVAFLKRKYEKNSLIRRIDRGYFEEYATEEKYNLIYLSGVAHWIQAKILYPKIWNMLEERGTLAVFYTNFEVIYRDYGIWKGLNEIKRRHLPDHSLGYKEEELYKDNLERQEDMRRYAGFVKIVHKEYQWNKIYDAKEYVSLINSASTVQLLDEKKRGRYLDDVYAYINAYGKGKIEVPIRVWLDMTKKVALEG